MEQCAVARAGELETLVHPRSLAARAGLWREREIRIRALIDELVTQREAILANAERVRLSISSSHESLREDLNSASGRIADAGSEAGVRVTQTLGAKAEEITGALSRTATMIEEIATRGGDPIKPGDDQRRHQRPALGREHHRHRDDGRQGARDHRVADGPSPPADEIAGRGAHVSR